MRRTRADSHSASRDWRGTFNRGRTCWLELRCNLTTCVSNLSIVHYASEKVRQELICNGGEVRLGTYCLSFLRVSCLDGCQLAIGEMEAESDKKASSAQRQAKEEKVVMFIEIAVEGVQPNPVIECPSSQ